MAEEQKQAEDPFFEYVEDGNDNFAHLLGGGDEPPKEMPKMNFAKSQPPKEGEERSSLQYQYSNLYEGESNAFDDIFERVEDSKNEESVNEAKLELQKTLDEAEPLISRLSESTRPKANSDAKAAG